MKRDFLYKFVKKNNISKNLFISYVTASLLVFYFLFITIFGEKGLIKYFELKKQIKSKEIVKFELQNKVKTKKAMVNGMDPENLDLDLVDEESRKVLGYVGKNEVVIYREN